jgi:DNA repair photolyase
LLLANKHLTSPEMPHHIIAKTILNKTKKRDSWFLDDYTINPYSGCSFNCLFCYIRGSKYGTHMEEKLSIKGNAVELLAKQLKLRASKNQYGIIVLSSATDPYLHFEKNEKLTRKILEVIREYRFPVHIITRSDLVTRDFDILHDINKHAILPLELQSKLNDNVLITFSFSTVDDKVAKIFEPGATAPSARLETLEKTCDEGFLSGVSMMPLIPYISDTTESLNNMFSSFKKAGAKYIMPAGITLFGNGTSDSKTLMFRAIEKYYPHLLEKYHKFFDNSNEMPAFYQKAFYKKMKELNKEYNIPDRIIYI